MEDINKWLENFKFEYRKIINTKFAEYKDFFPAFSGKIPYLRFDLWKIFYGDQLKEIELRLYKEEYADKIDETNTLKLKDIDEIENPKEKEMAYLKNEGGYQSSFLYPIDYEDGKPIVDIINPIQTVILPNEFQELKPKDFVFQDINSRILFYLRNNINRALFNKCRNRLSIIPEQDLKEIMGFLDKNWTELDDREKAMNFNKIFYYLGFETIPIELLLTHKKYKELNTISHPEIIIYDLNSNYILLIEELNKFTKEYLYKPTTKIEIIKKFNLFFPKYNRIIDYLIITNKRVSIDLKKYNFKDRVLLKDEFVLFLKKIFNPELLNKSLFGNYFRKNIRVCLNLIVDNKIKIF